MAELTVTVAQIEQIRSLTETNGDDDRFKIETTNLVSSRASDELGLDVPVLAVSRLDTDDETVYFVDGIGNVQSIS